MDVQVTLKQFDEYLSQHQAHLDAIIIGGAALIVMGVISRDTVDVDCLGPKLSEEILAHAANFRKKFPELQLKENWINNGPASLVRELPPGWRETLTPVFSGKALNLTTLSRMNLLRTKLFAFCDRDQDLQDCMALRPSAKELDACFDWVATRDANPDWPENVRRHFTLLGKKLGHGN